MKLGSLFSGSGGFEFAATLCGIKPVWASEIECYPIAVTKSRFPNMKHLGSVTDISGYDVEPVDIITFGSPCQDLSVAGKRKGLKHEASGDDETTRSGLFMDAIRIIKEMRAKTNGLYPRYAIWENVFGAFSSNKGEDFRTVLTEFVRIAEPKAPEVPKTDKGWSSADIIMGDGWSIAYRTFDAQYWGVPQCRRRIYLVADFRGERAGEILFEREGLRRDFETCETSGQGIVSDAERSVGTGDRVIGFDMYNQRSKGSGNGDRQTACTITGDPVFCLQGNGIDRADTAGCNGKGWKEDISYTLNTIDRHAVCYSAGNQYVNENELVVERENRRYIVRRLTPKECARLQGFPDGYGRPDRKDDFTDDEYQFWLDVRNTHAAINGRQTKEYSKEAMLKWYNNLHTDSAEYKMWGNGIALPCALYIMQGVKE